MKPGRLTLTIVQGATFRRRFVWKTRAAAGATPQPLDLSDYTGRAQMRVNGTAVLTFDSTPGPDVDGSIAFGSDGSIELLADADTVSAVAHGSGDWSLEVQPPVGDRDVLLMGQLTILEEVTV